MKLHKIYFLKFQLIKPYLFEIETHRWYDHVGVGTSEEYNYRNKNEIQTAKEKD